VRADTSFGVSGLSHTGIHSNLALCLLQRDAISRNNIAIIPRRREGSTDVVIAFIVIIIIIIIIIVVVSRDWTFVRNPRRARLLGEYGAVKISKRNSSIRRTRAAGRSFPKSPCLFSSLPELPSVSPPSVCLALSSALEKTRDKITPRHPSLAPTLFRALAR